MSVNRDGTKAKRQPLCGSGSTRSEILMNFTASGASDRVSVNTIRPTQ